MFTVTVDESMLEKLRGMLEDEDEGPPTKPSLPGRELRP